MAEQHLRQDRNGCYYWATDEPEQAAECMPPVVVPPVEAAAPVAAEHEPLWPMPATPAAAAKRTRSPRKAAPAPAPVTDSVTIPPPPPIIRG